MLRIWLGWRRLFTRFERLCVWVYLAYGVRGLGLDSLGPCLAKSISQALRRTPAKNLRGSHDKKYLKVTLRHALTTGSALSSILHTTAGAEVSGICPRTRAITTAPSIGARRGRPFAGSAGRDTAASVSGRALAPSHAGFGAWSAPAILRAARPYHHSKPPMPDA